jgi:hypothetical protein
MVPYQAKRGNLDGGGRAIPHFGLGGKAGLDLAVGCGKIPVMSRRRTTAKIGRVSVREEVVPPGSTQGQASAAGAGGLDAPGDRQHGNALEGAFGSWLASEASRRAASEQWTAETLGRYFKVTVAILCLNMVVGGANVAVSFMHAGEPRTVVVTQPAPAAPAPAPAVSGAVPAAAAPSSHASAPLSPATPPTSKPAARPIPLLGKVPLLGKPAKEAAARPSLAPVPTRPARAVTAPARIRPPVAPKEIADEEPEPEPSHLAAERW